MPEIFNPHIRTRVVPTSDPVSSRAHVARVFRDAHAAAATAYASADLRHLYDDLTLDSLQKSVDRLRHCSDLLADIGEIDGYDPADHD